VNTASPEEVIRAILGSPESDDSIDKTRIVALLNKQRK
jgi:hypothetical protein